jgi:galactonate dehydratase
MFSRRHLLRGALALALKVPLQRAHAALAEMKITRVRMYRSPASHSTVNQSAAIITVETDSGLVGIGEGGSPDGLRECAEMLIGEDPLRIERLWQVMYRGRFYPPGREKLHALGALDLALWDLKGKVLDAPVHTLLGGLSRKYVECYSTGFPGRRTLRDTARACMDAGLRAFRTSAATPPKSDPMDAAASVRRTVEVCREIREGVGPNGDWAIDFHTRYDLPQAVRLASLLEDLEPCFVEDLVRSENPDLYRTLRGKVNLPIAVGEHFGDRWDLHTLVENHLIDFSRVTLPNCGGITEFLKIAALCETHYVGLIPHFTGPVAQAALVHCCGVFPGPVMMEVTGDGTMKAAHLAECYDFREGKMWPNHRPGLGVTLRPEGLEIQAEITETSRPVPMLFRPDGSLTNW